MQDERPPSTRIDTTRPSIARVYDAGLGGKDNYAVDRQVIEQVNAIAQHQTEVAWMNRSFLVRVVRYLSAQVGMDQFLDLGSGLPTVQNTHQVAQENNPQARVVYVDNDPVCNAHGRALLEENDRTTFVEADLTGPKELLAHPEVAGNLDLSKPLVLMQIGTLHHVSDEQDPAAIMREYVDALPSGSYVAMTHFWDPGEENPELHRVADEAQRRMGEAGMVTGWFRGRGEIATLFGGLEPVPPGLVELHAWWPDGPAMREPWPEEHLMLGGLARKP